MQSAARYYVLIICCFRAKQAHWEAGPFTIFVELHFPRSKVQQKKKDLKPFLHKIRNISDILFNDNIQLFLFHLYFPSKVQLIGSLCAWNMKDDKEAEFWLSSFRTQHPLAQPSSHLLCRFPLLSPQLSHLLLQISCCCLATAPQAMSHRIAYYSFREINRREKILAVTLELLCTSAPKPGNSRSDIIVEFCTTVPRSSLTNE